MIVVRIVYKFLINYNFIFPGESSRMRRSRKTPTGQMMLMLMNCVHAKMRMKRIEWSGMESQRTEEKKVEWKIARLWWIYCARLTYMRYATVWCLIGPKLKNWIFKLITKNMNWNKTERIPEQQNEAEKKRKKKKILPNNGRTHKYTPAKTISRWGLFCIFIFCFVFSISELLIW